MKDQELKRTTGFYKAQVEHPPFRGISSEVVYYDEESDTVSIFFPRVIIRGWGNPVDIKAEKKEWE